jgi:hypothetical protein
MEVSLSKFVSQTYHGRKSITVMIEIFSTGSDDASTHHAPKIIPFFFFGKTGNSRFQKRKKASFLVQQLSGV